MSGSRYVQPYVYAYTSAGAPVPGALLNFYISGSSTRAATYADPGLALANANPVVADGAGTFPPIFLDPSVAYKAVLTTAPPLVGSPVTIWTDDPAGGGSLAGREASYIAAAGQTVFTSPVASPAGAAVYVNGTRQMPGDWTISGSVITLATGCAAGDSVDIVAFQDAVPTGPAIPPNVIDVLDYMTGGTPQTAALQQAVNDAFATGKTLWLPRTVTQLLTDATVTIPDGGISIDGGGTITCTADVPVFKLVGACALERFVFQTVHLLAAPPANACALELATTDGLKFIQYNHFDITSQGALATMINSSATRTTSFGQESAVNWNVFRLTTLGAAYPARNSYWSKAGSGTGNHWWNQRGALGATSSAYLRFDGTGCVVGDIGMLGAHLGAAAGGSVDCAAIEVGTGTVYRTNIAVVGCQSDANMARVFRFAGDNLTTAPYAEIKHDGSLIGGATIMGINVPILSGSLDDRDDLDWSGAKRWSTNATGAQVVPICQVTLGQYESGRLTLDPSGLVGGVSAGSATIVIELESTNVAASASIVSTTSNPGGLFGASVSATGMVVTVNLTFTPTTTGSKGRARWNCDGENLCVERL